MTELNNTTKDAKQKIRAYENARYCDVIDAYTHPSKKKIISFKQLLEKMKSLNGWGMRITGAGSHYYSCAFLIKEDNITYLIYETATNTYKIKYSKE